MIKRIKIPSIRILKLILFFTFLIGLFVTFYTFLHKGIWLEHINLPNSRIEGFYLRLDKKLILEIQSLHVKQPDSSDKISISSQVFIAKNAHLILQYFQKIDIKNIYMKDYQANLFYDGDNFTLNLPEFYAKLNLLERASKVFIKIHDFYFKPYGIHYQGDGIYDLRHQEITINGNLNLLDRTNYHSYVRLDLEIFSNLKTINIKGSSNVFDNIQFLKPLLPEINNQFVAAWIFDNYTIDNLQINDFSLAIPIKSKRIFQDSINSLSVLATANNAQVTFHPKLAAAHAKSIKLLFQNNTLEFHPESPTYKHYQANGTTVAIKNLIGQAPILEVNLNAVSPLDKNIHEVLETYGIKLPLDAPSAAITTRLFIHIDLLHHTFQTKGIFTTQNSKVLLNGIPLESKTLNVLLENHIIKVESKYLTYQNILQGDSSFIINTREKTISGDILIHSFVLARPDILQISNHSLPFSVDFKNQKAITLSLPTLTLEGTLKAPYAFSIKDLNRFTPFSQILQDYKVIHGTLQLNTKDFLEYQAKISANSAQNILIDKKSHLPITTFNLDLLYNRKGFLLQHEFFSLTGTQDAQTINFNNINLNLNSKNLTSTNPKHIKTPILIKGSNTNLMFKDYTILADSFSFNVYNQLIQGTLKHKNGVADFYKNGDSITLNAREFGDDFLNAITKKHIFNNGRFFINAQTNDKGVIVGKMRLLGTSINELRILQNIMAFIDTIPSLLSLKIPGFSNKGYFLEEGNIHFGLNDTFLAIDALDFKGSSIDIKGRGIIQLESKDIDFNAELIIIKALSGIINKIPVVNYIILGKNGNISTMFKIHGTTENPQIQTQTAQDILLSPFNILKRVITSPFEVFN